MVATSWFVAVEDEGGSGGAAIGRPFWFVNDPDEMEPPGPTVPTVGQIWPRGNP